MSTERVYSFPFQFFEGKGWFTGKDASFDGQYYQVNYQDGDNEEYDD
jgi:hypothetical protein